MSMKTILVLTDFSRKAEHAAEMAIQIATVANARVHLFSVFHAAQVFPSDAGVFPFFEDYSEEEKATNFKLEKLAHRLHEKFGKQSQPAINCSSRPGDLVDHIEEIDPWLIVMGGKSDASGLNNLLFGSNSSAVIDNASCPVLIVPGETDLKAFRRIIFASALQPSEKKALSFIEEFGSLWNASIVVLHVSVLHRTEDIWNEQYDYYKEIISDTHPTMRYVDVRGSDIAGAINSYAKREATGLVAIAHKKRSVIGQLFHKSIGREMLNYKNLPVLVLHTS